MTFNFLSNHFAICRDFGTYGLFLNLVKFLLLLNSQIPFRQQALHDEPILDIHVVEHCAFQSLIGHVPAGIIDLWPVSDCLSFLHLFDVFHLTLTLFVEYTVFEKSVLW